jgi:hypothetical protein
LLSHCPGDDLPQEISVNALVIHDALEHRGHPSWLQLLRKQLIQSDSNRLNKKADENLIHGHPAAGNETFGHPEEPRKASSSASTQKLLQHLHVARLLASVVSKTTRLTRIFDASRFFHQNLKASPLEHDSNAKDTENLGATVSQPRGYICKREGILLAVYKDAIPALGLAAFHRTSPENDQTKSIEPLNRIARWPCG